MASTKGDMYSLSNVVMRCWEEENLKDVTLESNDGKEFRATRVVLAARSDKLEQILTKDNSPTSRAPVRIDLNGFQLENLVEFCYTDNAKVLTENFDKADIQKIPDLLMLQGAISELMPPFAKAITVCVKNYIQKFPQLCFAAYEAWRSETGSAEELGEILLDIVRATPVTSLKSDQLKSLRATTCKLILEDTEMQATEEDLFRFLQLWVACDPTDRKELATGFVEHIKLEDISPQVLSTVVASSGFVSGEDMMEAYKNQALAAANQQPVKFHKKRVSTTPVWSSTMTALSSQEKKPQSWKADVLEIPPMKSGKYEWSLEMVSVTDGASMFAWLGMATSKNPINAKESLEEQKGCWSVSDRCRGVAQGDTVFMDEMGTNSLEDGYSLEFYLDLTKGDDEDANGVLEVKVNRGVAGMQSSSLGKFTGLLAYLEKNPGAGFVPAMSIRDECCVIKASGAPKKVD